MNRLYPVLFFIFSVHLFSQEARISLDGVVRNDSIPIENVHIINGSSRKGSISNYNGEFQISVKSGDTLILSDIQYTRKIIVINNNDIDSKYLKVSMTQRTNKLQEVVIKESKNMAKALNLPNADKTPLKPIERKINFYNKGGALNQIYGLVSGNTKKLKKLRELENADEIDFINKKNIQTIRTHFTDGFFLNTLKIPKEKIDLIIEYCLPKGIVFLYQRERFIEIVDIFIKNKEAVLILE